jgi:hypothetical protein
MLKKCLVSHAMFAKNPLNSLKSINMFAPSSIRKYFDHKVAIVAKNAKWDSTQNQSMKITYKLTILKRKKNKTLLPNKFRNLNKMIKQSRKMKWRAENSLRRVLSNSWKFLNSSMKSNLLKELKFHKHRILLEKSFKSLRNKRKKSNTRSPSQHWNLSKGKDSPRLLRIYVRNPY